MTLSIELSPTPGPLNAEGVPGQEAPSVRDAVRTAGLFTKTACLIEERARSGGGGGVVRIKELAPVLAAMNAFLDALPIGQLER